MCLNGAQWPNANRIEKRKAKGEDKDVIDVGVAVT